MNLTKQNYKERLIDKKITRYEAAEKVVFFFIVKFS